MTGRLSPHLVNAGAVAIHDVLSSGHDSPADYVAAASACYEEIVAATSSATPLPHDAWAIVFDDRDMPLEVFTGPGARGAAHRRFQQISISYACHLFRKILEQ